MTCRNATSESTAEVDELRYYPRLPGLTPDCHLGSADVNPKSAIEVHGAHDFLRVFQNSGITSTTTNLLNVMTVIAYFSGLIANSLSLVLMKIV